MSVQIVRFRTAPEDASEVEGAIARLFAAMAAAAPEGIEYEATRVGDDPEFVLTLQLSSGGPNPLLDVAEAVAFRSNLSRWAGGPVTPTELRVLGRYRA